MECSVCYDDIKNTCKLICGHSFCMSCIKKWYLKSEDQPTCPMCRKRLYFKGMHKQEEKWENERRETEIKQVFENGFNMIIEAVLGEYDDGDYCMYSLSEFESNFNKYKDFQWGGGLEDLEDVVLYGCETYNITLPFLVFELLMKYISLIRISKINLRRFSPNIYFSFV